MDMDEFQEMYASESREHLDILNDALLTLENDPENMEMVNESFRAAHTLKGMAGTMGFDQVSELAHAMENILDELRNGEIAVTTEVINLLFRAVDNLELLSSDPDQVEDLEGLIKELRNYTGDDTELSTGNQETSASSNNDYFSLDQDELEMVEDTPGETVIIKVILESDCVFKSLRADMVFDALEELGELIKANPSIDDIREEKLDEEFQVLFLTKESKETLSDALSNISEVDTIEIEVVEDLDDLSIQQESTGAEQEDESTIDGAKDKDSKSKKKSKTQSLSSRLRSSSTIKVDVDRLDSLMNLVAELVIKRTQVESVARSYDLDDLEKKLKPLSKVTTDLQDAVMEMRMVPISMVFNRFPRLVRDLAQDLEKDINLKIEGEETELDRTIIDEIGDPLVHLIRNSIDHGIEPPAEREEKDKPREGLVKLSAFHEGNNVVIQIEDDGAGIDPDVIEEKAIDKGVASPSEIENMSDQEIINLIFAPGFSTNEEVSDVSGRGVGMDVVKNKLDSLNGSIDIKSEVGKGSTFTMKLPLTLSIIQGFLTTVADQKYVIPLESIQEIVDVQPEDIQTIRQEQVIHRRGSVIPLISLRNKLGKEDDFEEEEISTVIVEIANDYYGLMVDSIIGQQEVVIKRINDLSENIEKIAGGAILGDGSIALILNVEEITIG
ncbi:chemotaxis protein CheA [Halanaerobacter jeridensis]|uniref:Chemotaxis protein CheA n=1 Tax=Halanaerobacter jeridensis TaxID=706427 RepID=A0A938XQV2_9FIRM|nr:chemotaxis protein CheA [Halanaerobacter jeridensis]MBM7555974.1 two-component system chemotaxis sensor kinase CheA [Halanaerobacter jeridensis]